MLIWWNRLNKKNQEGPNRWKKVKMIFLLQDFSQLYLLIYFWLCWVFVATRRLSLVAVSGGHSVAVCRLSQCSSLSRCRAQAVDTQASEVVACGLISCGSRALEHRLSGCGSRALEHRLSGCGSRTLLHSGMWDLPGPGIEPVSPELAGGFLTTRPPGKPSPSLWYVWRFIKEWVQKPIFFKSLCLESPFICFSLHLYFEIHFRGISINSKSWCVLTVLSKKDPQQRPWLWVMVSTDCYHVLWQCSSSNCHFTQCLNSHSYLLLRYIFHCFIHSMIFFPFKKTHQLIVDRIF